MPAFMQLDTQTQKDLLEWFNVAEPDTYDKMRLAKLAEDGLFEAWGCPQCGDRVYHGRPANWDHYQGVRQRDYISYPGNADKYTPEYLSQMCDHCRMYS